MPEYLVVFEHQGDSWGAYAPDLPGLGVVGDSIDEVRTLISDGIAVYLDALRDTGESAPPPTARAEIIAV